MRPVTLSALGLFLLTAVPVMAQDLLVYGGGTVEMLFDPNGDGSGNETSLTSYIEAERLGFYGGVGVKIVDDHTADEIDPYIGYRGDNGAGFSYGIVYTYYGLPNSADADYSELNLNFGKTLGDKASVSADFNYYPDDSTKSASVGAEYYPTDKITLSANYGTYDVFEAASEREWDLGIGYNITDEAAAELRYYDGSEYVDSYIGLTISFDTTLLGR